MGLTPTTTAATVSAAVRIEGVAKAAQFTMSAGHAAKRRESPASLAQFLLVANHTGIAHNVCTTPATDIVHIGRLRRENETSIEVDTSRERQLRPWCGCIVRRKTLPVDDD